MFKKQKIIFLICFLILILLFRNSFLKEEKSEQFSLKQHLVSTRDILATVYGTGKIYPQQESTIYSEISGEIKDILIEEGQQVKQGELLMVIENKEISQEIKMAEAKLLNAREKLKEIKSYPSKTNILTAESTRDKTKANLERLKKSLKDEEELLSKGFSSNKKVAELRETLNIVENDLKVAEENFKKAKEKPKEHEIALCEANLNKAEIHYNNLREKEKKQKIYAPFSGTIIEIHLPRDDRTPRKKIIKEGPQLITIANMEHLIIKGEIFESDINKIKPQQTVFIQLNENKNKIKGKLSFISQKAKAIGNINKFKVEVTLEDSSPLLKYGMSVSFQIVIDSKNKVLSIPLEYIQKEEGKYFVYKLSGKKLVKTFIEKGLDDNRYGEILAGLKKDEVVAVKY
jgi:HlyD family secretion protein